MKKLFNNIARTLLVLAAVAGSSIFGYAGVKVSIPELTVDSYEPFEIPVSVVTTDDCPLWSFQVNLQLPDFLELQDGATLRYDSSVLGEDDYSAFLNKEDATAPKIMVLGYDYSGETRFVSDGELFWIPVKAKEGTLSPTRRESVNFLVSAEALSGPVLDKTNKDQYYYDVTLENPTAVKIVNPVDLKATLSFGKDSYVLNPGGKTTVTLALDAEFDAYAMTFYIDVPDGVSIQKSSFVAADRTNATVIKRMSFAKVDSSIASNRYGVVLSALQGTSLLKLFDGTSGDILSFDLEVSDSYSGNGTLKIVNSNVSDENGNGAYPKDITVGTVSGAPAKANADALVAQLEASLKEANDKVAADYESFATDEAVVAAQNAAQSALDEFKAAVEAAYADFTLTTNYDEAVAGKEAVEEAIAAIIPAAEAAKAAAEAARVAANEAAAQADADVIAGLQAALDAAKAEVAENSPVGVNAETETALQGQIDALTQAVATETARVASEGEYASQVGGADAVKTAIDQYVADAKAAQEAEEARVAANEAAAQADLQTIADLQARYREVIVDVKADYAEYEDVRAEDAALKAISDAKDAVEAALAAVATEGEYESPLNADELSAQIEKLLTDAQAAKAAAEEAARVAANEAAAQADADVIAGLQSALDAAKAEVAENSPVGVNAETETALQGQIDALTQAVAAETARVAEEGEYASQVEDAEAVKAAIDQYVADAKAAQEAKDAADAAEAARVAANEAAAQADAEAIKALQEALDAVKAEVAEKYPVGKSEETETAIQEKIDGLSAHVAIETARVAEAGEYASQVAEAKEIQSAIDQYLGYAKGVQERSVANDEAQKADEDTIKEVEDTYSSILDQISNLDSDVVSQDAKDSIQDAINNLKDNVNNEGDRVAQDGDEYNQQVTDETKQKLLDEIKKLYDDAKAAQEAKDAAEAARQQANADAAQADADAIKALQDALDAAKADVAENYAVGQDAEAEQAIQDQIDALTDAVATETARVAEEGEYASQVEDTDAIQTAIDQYVADAKAAQAVVDAIEQARVDANEAAAQADVAVINALQDAFNAAKAEVADNYAEGRDEETESDIQAQITDLSRAVADEAARVEKEGVYETQVAGASAIQAAIDQYVADAKASQERQAAYASVEDSIDAVESAYNDAVAEIESDYESALESDKIKDLMQSIEDKIAEARNEAAAAYATADENNTDYDYNFSPDAIQALIDELLSQAAGVDGVSEITVDTIVNGYIYTLDGVRHDRPVQGQINIIKTKDSVRKVYVR